MSSIAYLIQGKAKMLGNFQRLRERADVDVLLLSYDQQVPGALYLPDSTWAQGRNRLLEAALAGGRDYRYLIFLDDDVTFQHGGFEAFEALLARYRPAVAVPVFAAKTASTIIGLGLTGGAQPKHSLPVQLCRRADGQFLALHRDVIADRVAVPLQTQFDTVSWWFTSSTQQLLLHTLYPAHFLQFNRVVVANDCHGEYANASFKPAQQAWMTANLRLGPRDPRRWADSFLRPDTWIRSLRSSGVAATFRALAQFWATLYGSLNYRPMDSYRLSPERGRRLLVEDSDLRRQFEASLGLGE